MGKNRWSVKIEANELANKASGSIFIKGPGGIFIKDPGGIFDEESECNKERF